MSPTRIPLDSRELLRHSGGHCASGNGTRVHTDRGFLPRTRCVNDRAGGLGDTLPRIDLLSNDETKSQMNVLLTIGGQMRA